MKKLFLLCTILQLSLQGYSQFPIYTLLPLDVSGIVFSDTLLNTSSILKREGIRKIIATQASSKSTIDFSWEYLITNGKISSRKWCILRPPYDAAGSCYLDTILYDSKGRLQEFLARTDRGYTYMQRKVEYIGEGKATDILTIRDSQKDVWDTSVYHYYYNEIGLPIRWEQEQKPGLSKPIRETLYYNHDGLLDSIRHIDPAGSTDVFKRNEKGKIKIIELETPFYGVKFRYRWVYNSSLQCISSQSSSITTNYFYNTDGTLSKVKEEHSYGETNTIVYSYFK